MTYIVPPTLTDCVCARDDRASEKRETRAPHLSLHEAIFRVRVARSSEQRERERETTEGLFIKEVFVEEALL